MLCQLASQQTVSAPLSVALDVAALPVLCLLDLHACKLESVSLIVDVLLPLHCAGELLRVALAAVAVFCVVARLL